MEEEDDEEYIRSLIRVCDAAEKNYHLTCPHKSITGLYFKAHLISPEEERLLLAHIDACPWSSAISRRTQHYGYLYNYTSKEAAKRTTPIPDWVGFVMDRLLHFRLLETRPDQLIINEYLPGQGIAFHIDNTQFFADGVVSVSLGSFIIMDFTLGNDGRLIEVELPPQSAIALHGDARYKWRHGITCRKSDHGKRRERRVSLTFRKMKE